MNASKKVIVIEDEPDIQEIIVHNLLRDGYQVEATPNGERGLEMVRRLDPDLVLLDLMLPGLDGVEVCRRMKTDPRTRAISIIMVTARGEESDIVLGLGLGATTTWPSPSVPGNSWSGSRRCSGEDHSRTIRAENESSWETS